MSQIKYRVRLTPNDHYYIYNLELEVEGIFDDIFNSTCRSLEVY